METDLNQERRHAHALLDAPPAEKLNAVRNLLEVMVEPLARSLAVAEVEEEDVTPDTASALDHARASLARGEGIPRDEGPRRIRPQAVSEEVKKLKPPRTGFRLRCGDYRIFFDHGNETTIEITGARHRRQAYR